MNGDNLALDEGKVALRVVLGGEKYLASGDNVEGAKHAASLQVRVNILLVGGLIGTLTLGSDHGVALRVVLGGEKYLASGDNVEGAKHAASLQVREHITSVGSHGGNNH